MSGPYYLSDRQIAAQLGISYPTWLKSVAELEKAGLPLRDPALGNKRHWPAVCAFLDRRVGYDTGKQPTWEENFT